MRTKRLTKTICFKTTDENFNYLKMFGNVNRKLNEFVSTARAKFESFQAELVYEDELLSESENTSGLI